MDALMEIEDDDCDIVCRLISSSSSSSDSLSDISESEEILSEIDLQKYCKNAIFIDMRGSNFGRFICKEFCLIDTDGDIYHKFIKSSFPMKKLKYVHQLKVDYEQKYGHRIPYDYGDINIVELITDIYPKMEQANKKIFVRDKLIRHHLQHMFRNYCQFNDRIETLCQLNFDRKTISKKLDLQPYCEFHNTIFGWATDGLCAKNIALKLRHIYAEAQKERMN